MAQTITAIVPTYNRAVYLSEALASIASQTRPVDEIIVWDDGSTDATETVARAAAGPVRYFRSANGGKSRALNAAMAKATGSLIWICDDDDIALPHAAQTLAGLLGARSDADVAGGSYRRFHTDPGTGARIERGPGYWPDLSQGSVLRHLLEDIFLFQNATLVRRSAYEAVGGFREDLPRSIDYDMIVRLAVRAPVVMTEKAVFLQRKHDGARGPATARHAAARSGEVWQIADRDVFAPFRKSVPLSLYEALFEGTPDAVRRAGLLQRACVYARRTDWAAACEDFGAAAEVAPECPLSELEVAICRRAMGGKHGIVQAMIPEVRHTLAHLARSGPLGAAIARALNRGLRWRLREAVAARRFGDIAGIARLGLGLFSGRDSPSEALTMPLTERDDPCKPRG